MSTFSLQAAPDTDIWRKPPSTDVFNGKPLLNHDTPHSSPTPNYLTSSQKTLTQPLLTIRTLQHPSAPQRTPKTHGPLSTFLSAQVSLSFAWTEQYDQGGLLLALRRAGDGPRRPAGEVDQDRHRVLPRRADAQHGRVRPVGGLERGAASREQWYGSGVDDDRGREGAGSPTASASGCTWCARAGRRYRSGRCAGCLAMGTARTGSWRCEGWRRGRRRRPRAAWRWSLRGGR